MRIFIYIISLVLLVPVLVLDLRFYISQDFEKLTEESGLIAERNPLFSLVAALLFLAAVLLVMLGLRRLFRSGRVIKPSESGASVNESIGQTDSEKDRSLLAYRKTSGGSYAGRRGGLTAAVILLVLMAAVAVFGIRWVRMNPLYPSADQEAVWEMGEYLNDPSGEIPYTYTPNYWIKYPQQKFIALFMAALIRLTGIHSYRIYQYLNIAGLLLLIPEMYGFGKLTAGGRPAGLTAAVLTALFAPLILYTSYVYPTLLSFTAVIASFDLFLSDVQKMRKRAVWKSALILSSSSACMAFANLFYSATLIALIAEGGYAVLCAIEDVRRGRERSRSPVSSAAGGEITSVRQEIPAKPEQRAAESADRPLKPDRKHGGSMRALLPLAGILLTVLLSLSGRTATEKIFDARTGLEASDGMPASAWILMGITSDSEESVAGPGSYDMSAERVYREFDYDSEATSVYVNGQIGETLREYFSGKRPLSFFVKKTIHQWCDPWFSSLAMAADQNSAYMLDDEGLAQMDSYLRFLKGPFMKGLQGFLLVFQTAVYLGAAVGIVLSICRTAHGEEGCSLLPVIFFIGGFLFQLFWESKARYCMPYFICLLPIVSYGMQGIADCFFKRCQNVSKASA